MPSSTEIFRKLLGAVSARSSPRFTPSFPSSFRSRRPLQSRVTPLAALAGAAGISSIAYYARSSSVKEDAASLVPQISPSKSPSTAADVGVSPVRALDLAAANEKLKKEERSLSFEIEPGKTGRFDVVRLASNEPVEDEYAFGTAPGPGNQPWTFWGVYDGHAGWATSSVLRDALIPYVARELGTLPATAPAPAITAAITRAFTSLDAVILGAGADAVTSEAAAPGSAIAIAALAPAVAGSCALLTLWDGRTSTLRCACVGDSRAVLGRYEPGPARYAAVPLSRDQTGFDDAEYARICAAHPGEETDILDRKSGRLLGLAVTRAFGDHRWKWSEALIGEAHAKFWGSAPRPKSKSPPYLVAEPVMQEVVVEKGPRGDFVIMASDGLWDHISSEDAVECVAGWIEARRQGKVGKVGVVQKSVPGGMPEFELDDGKYVEWKATPEHFVVEDDNAATHLVKNAFGGTRRNLFCGVMTAYPPISRNVRDDVTVQVIFFRDV